MTLHMDRSFRLPESEYFPGAQRKSGIAIHHGAEEAPHQARVRHWAARRCGCRSGRREEHPVRRASTAEVGLSPCRRRSYGRGPSLRNALVSSYISLMSTDISLM